MDRLTSREFTNQLKAIMLFHYIEVDREHWVLFFSVWKHIFIELVRPEWNV